MSLVLPLLSPRGTVELRASNTLMLRDSIASLERILPLLYAFDHPAQPVEVELWLVRASGAQVSPVPPPRDSGLPVQLLRSLRNSFGYLNYDLVGTSTVRVMEGERITFEVAKDFTVRFRLGTIVGDQRLRLNDFEVLLDSDSGEPASLLKSQLNVWLDKTVAMGLTAGKESPTALLVVVRCAAADRPKKGRR